MPNVTFCYGGLAFMDVLVFFIMSKELPFFKFEPNQWENGNIQMCNRELKGLFIDLCSMYWARLGDLSYKLAVQKLCDGNAFALESLKECEMIDVIEGHICIDFLNEQLSEFEITSKRNSQIAKDGWVKRRNDANAKRTQCERNAIRGEERREEEIREEIVKSGSQVEQFFTDLPNSKAFENIQKQLNVSKETLVMYIKPFRSTCKPTYESFGDFVSHFKNSYSKWLKTQINEKPAKRNQLL